MKKLFINAEYKGEFIDMFRNFKVKGKIGLVATIQFLKHLKDVKKILDNAIIGGQVLGCDVSNAIKIMDKVDIFLFVGDGRFHPLEIARKTKKRVFIANPINKEIYELKKDEVKRYENKIKGKITKFLNAKRIGILVSLKPGQENLKKAFEFREKLDKESFIFIGNEIRKNDLENFPDIEYWVNSACPRIDEDGIVSIEELERYKN